MLLRICKIFWFARFRQPPARDGRAARLDFLAGLDAGGAKADNRGMLTKICIPLLAVAIAARADLVLEQQFSDANRTRTAILKLHDSKMRLDQPDVAMSVIVDLNTRDSYTLLTTNKTFLNRFGSEIRWEMSEEKKYSHGTNDLDWPAAPAVDTGRSEKVNGRETEVFTWSGAHGVTETLWVDKAFPNYDAIRAELAKMDWFNDAGPHRNAQPPLSRLPGMVVKSVSASHGRLTTNTLVSVKLKPVDPALFEVPADYKPWKRETKRP